MPGPSRRVVVIGGGLAGMAAAARLAKGGHQVSLVEAGDRLGGRWADDLAPPVLSFPAPWRDLFRKSGRPLEEECRRAGLELRAAPPARHTFADGSTLELPTNRGDQQSAVSALGGPRAAEAWRDLVDALAGLWQQLRFLGLETELARPAALDRRTRAALWSDRSVAELAAALPDRRLSSLVADLGHLNGSTPDRTPAHVAVSLFVDQAFGRWQLCRADRPESPVSLSAIVELLTARLELRRVSLRLNTAVRSIETDDDGVRAVQIARSGATGGPERLAADAVVVCADPWRLYREWLGGVRGSRAFRAERRSVDRAEPALVPLLSRATGSPVESDATAQPVEEYQHHDGPPVLVTRHLPADGDSGPIVVRYDYRSASPDPDAGIRWPGFSGWLDRPPTRSALRGLFLAGPWSRAGHGPDREILSAALAAAAASEFLGSAPAARAG